jgi:hypothetical protein
MIRKIFSMSIIAFFVIGLSTFAVSADERTITITDGTGDVLNENEQYVERDDVDIEQITCVQDGKSVELTLKLAPGGTIQNTGLLAYTIALITTGNEYAVAYSYQDEENPVYSCYGFYGSENEMSIKECSGAGTNTLTVSFDLISSNEVCISLGAICYEAFPLSASYYGDEANLDTEPLLPMVNETYNATTGKKLELSADIEGTSTDYNWVWTFEGKNDVLEGKDATYTFNIPDIYTGTVYVFDDEGNWGTAYFTVNVTGQSVNDENGGNGSGNGLLMFGGLLIIIIIIGVIVVVIISRR